MCSTIICQCYTFNLLFCGVHVPVACLVAEPPQQYITASAKEHVPRASVLRDVEKI